MTFKRSSVALIAAFSLLFAACSTSTEIVAGSSTATNGTASSSTDGSSAAEPTAAETATEEAAPEPTVEIPTVPRIVPAGWADYDRGTYQVATPASWDALTDVDDIDEMLDAASGQIDIPAAALEQYRTVLQGGNAIVALGPLGDNFNAFRQRGSVAQLGTADQIAGQLEDQFATFAQNVEVTAANRMFGETAGIATTGTYSLSGQNFWLYQFSTANGDHLYFFTVTLLTGPDQTLADQVFTSIAFTDS